VTDRDQHEATDDAPAIDKPPHLDESVRRIGAAGRAILGSALDTGRAMRRLVFADLALARSSLGRALAWFAVAIVFGASAWLLVAGALIAFLHAFGWSWLLSLAVCSALSLAVTGLAAWRVSTFFDLAGLHATRRQLSRLGIGDEADHDHDDDDASSSSTSMSAPTPSTQAGAQ
jgi:hypothetical protein